MKRFTTIRSLVLTMVLMLGISSGVWGATTTLFSFTGSSYAWPLATEWTNGGTGVSGGTYIKLSPGWTTSPIYTATNNLIFKYDVAAFGSGNANSNTQVYILKTDDTVYATYTLTGANSSTYIINQTLSIGNIDFDFKIKIEGIGTGVNSTSTRGTRLQNISLRGDEITSTPTISALPTTISLAKELGALQNATKDITVTGSNLTTNISATVSGTDATLFTVSKASLVPAGETITVTYNPIAVGTHNATLTLSSTGAADVSITLTGTCTFPPLAKPIIGTPNVVSEGFTANWGAVDYVDSYRLDVYTKTGEAPITILEKDFNDLTTAANSLIDFSKESSYTGWNGTVIYNGNTQTSHTSNMIANNLKVSTGSNNGNFSFPCALIGEATLSFDLKNWTNTAGTAGDATASLQISHASDGTNFVPLTNIDLTTIDPIEFVRQSINIIGGTSNSIFKFEATKRMFIDNLTISSGSQTITPITGSPFVDLTDTFHVVSGLSNKTTYYYTVTAVRGEETSISDEAEITPDVPNAIENNSVSGNLFTTNNTININLSSAQPITVYNIQGQALIQTNGKEGWNQINLSTKGIVVVKVGNTMTKVML